MSVNQSNLSLPQYGYDFVVASTLQAINANLFQFLSETEFPLITQYYWTDAHNNISLVPLATLQTTPVATGTQNPSGTNGVDPSTVAAWSGHGQQPVHLSNLANSSFDCGFIAQIGIPQGFCLPGVPNPQNFPLLPYMVTFDEAGMSVVLNLYCSSFQIFDATWGRGGIINYNNQSQPFGSAWYLQATVPISTLVSNNNLPKAVQARLNNLGPAAFSVQQLFLDFDQASSSTATPANFGGIQLGPALESVLSKVFGGLYYAGLSGMPALGYSILPNSGAANPSTFGLGSMEIEVDPYIIPSGQADQPGLATMNYLCSQRASVPPANPFSWNWIDSQVLGIQYDGVIAINRNSLAWYLAEQLAPFAARNCLQPNVSVDAGPDYNLSISQGALPDPTFPATGSTVLSFVYNSIDSQDSGGVLWALDYGFLDMNSTYTLTVQFQGNTITVVQTLSVSVNICWEDTCESGKFVNKTITDVYTINVSETGNLVLSAPVSSLVDSSDKPSAGWFEEIFTNINDIVSDVENFVNFAASNFGSLPVALIDNFIFPGGNTFTYANIGFSDNQDLVSYITYVDPGYRKMWKEQAQLMITEMRASNKPSD